MRNTFVNELILEAEKNSNIVLLTGDLGGGCLEPFMEKFPDRFFNVGIAEQNMLALASGLASEGKKVFIYSIGNFDTLRCLEQIRNDVCYMNLDVNIISVGAGLEYGQLGFSHHATEDIACMRALPNMAVFDTATISELKMAFNKMCSLSSPCYLRLNKKGIDISTKCPTSGQPYLIKSGKFYAIFSTGTILKEALECAQMLESEGISVAVYSCPMIKPTGSNLVKLMLGYSHIFSLEEHTILGGFGSSLAELLAPIKGEKPSLTILGINDKFLSKVGDRNYLRGEYGINAAKLYKKIKKELNLKKGVID